MTAQHVHPCKVCPFRRVAARGWLGGLTPKTFMELVTQEVRMPCHSNFPNGVDYRKAQDATKAEHAAPQCAGRAIYWGNTCKLPRDPSLLTLPRDPVAVFANRIEFIAHHEEKL